MKLVVMDDMARGGILTVVATPTSGDNSVSPSADVNETAESGRGGKETCCKVGDEARGVGLELRRGL